MYREIIFYGNHFILFYQNQDQKAKEKIIYTLDIIRKIEKIPTKFLKHIVNTRGLYEIRISSSSNIYRVFCCFDEGNLVILFNAFQKKTEKTPSKEIEKAKKLMDEYFKNK
jgi:phage-related protein